MMLNKSALVEKFNKGNPLKSRTHGPFRGHCGSIFRMIFSAFAIESAIQKSSAGHGRSICASFHAAKMLAAMKYALAALVTSGV
jgi:hypothetical protein